MVTLNHLTSFKRVERFIDSDKALDKNVASKGHTYFNKTRKPIDLKLVIRLSRYVFAKGVLASKQSRP